MSQNGYSTKYSNQASNIGKKKTIKQLPLAKPDNSSIIEKYCIQIKQNKQQKTIRQTVSLRNYSQLIYNFLTNFNDTEIDVPRMLDEKHMNAFTKLRQKLKRLELSEKLFTDAGQDICHKLNEEDRIIQYANTFNVIKKMLIVKKPISQKEYKYFVSEQNQKLIHQLERFLTKPLNYDLSQIQDEFIHILEKLKKGQTSFAKSKNRLFNNNRIPTLLAEIHRGLSKNQSEKKIGGNTDNSKLLDKVKQYQSHFDKFQKQIINLKDKIKKLNETLTKSKTDLQQSKKKYITTKQQLQSQIRKSSLITEERKVLRETASLKSEILTLTECIIGLTHQNQSHKQTKQYMKQVIFSGQEEKSNIRIQYIRIKQELADQSHQFCQLKAYCQAINEKNNQLFDEAFQLKGQIQMKDQQIQMMKRNIRDNNRQIVNDYTKQYQSNFDEGLIAPPIDIIQYQLSSSQHNKHEGEYKMEFVEECKQCKQLLEQIKRLIQKKDQGQKDLDIAHLKLTLQDFTIENITKINKQLSAQCEQKQLNLSTLIAEMQLLNNRLQQQRQIISLASKQSQNHVQQISQKDLTISILQNKILQLDKQLQQKCKQIILKQQRVMASNQNIDKLQRSLKQSEQVLEKNMKWLNTLNEKEQLIVRLQKQSRQISLINSELGKGLQLATRQKQQVDLQLLQINAKHLEFKQNMMKQSDQNIIKSSYLNSQLVSLIQVKQSHIQNVINQLHQLRQMNLALQEQSKDKTGRIKELQQKLCQISILQQQLNLEKIELNNCRLSLRSKQNQLTNICRKLQQINQIKSEIKMIKIQLEQQVKSKFNEQSLNVRKFIQKMQKRETQIINDSQSKFKEKLHKTVLERDQAFQQASEYRRKLESAIHTIQEQTRNIAEQKENNKITMMAHTTIIEDQRKVHKLQKDELLERIKQLSEYKQYKDASCMYPIGEIADKKIQENLIIAKIEMENLRIEQKMQQNQLTMNFIQQSPIDYICSAKDQTEISNQAEPETSELQDQKERVNSQNIIIESIEDLKSKLQQKDSYINQLIESEERNLKFIEQKQNNIRQRLQKQFMQRLTREMQEKQIAMKTQSDSLLKIKIQQQKIEQLKQKLRSISQQLSHRPNISDLQVDLLFQNNIFDDMIDYKRFLKEALQKHTGSTIKSTKLIFSFDPQNKTNFHHYLKDKANILLIVRMMNGYYFACYSEAAFQATSKEKKDGLIVSITNRDVFPLVSSDKKAISYDEYYLIFGNSQVRIKSQENRVFSNFGINNQFYCSRGKKVDWLLGGDKNEREQDLQYYQIYQLSMIDF